MNQLEGLPFEFYQQPDGTFLFQINAVENPHVQDVDLVSRCMLDFCHRYPRIAGYQFFYQEEFLFILMWR